MIKNNQLPIEYDCLFFLKDGSIHIGRLENSINVVAYSVVNRPLIGSTIHIMVRYTVNLLN